MSANLQPETNSANHKHCHVINCIQFNNGLLCVGTRGRLINRSIESSPFLLVTALGNHRRSALFPDQRRACVDIRHYPPPDIDCGAQGYLEERRLTFPPLTNSGNCMLVGLNHSAIHKMHYERQFLLRHWLAASNLTKSAAKYQLVANGTYNCELPHTCLSTDTGGFCPIKLNPVTEPVRVDN